MKNNCKRASCCVGKAWSLSIKKAIIAPTDSPTLGGRKKITTEELATRQLQNALLCKVSVARRHVFV